MRVRVPVRVPVRVIVSVLAAVGATLLPVLAAGPAAAGGPTSVLLSAPNLATTASLYTTDAAYAALAEQVGAATAIGSADGAGGSASSAPAARAVGDAVTLTWLIHDVSVWRVDRVYVDAPGGPWIASQEDVTGSGNIWDAPEVWHKAAEPKALLQLLGSFGLVAGTGPASGTGATADPPAAQSGSEGRSAGGSTRGATEAEGRDPTALVLASLLGLAVGVLGTVLAMAALRRRSSRATWDLAQPLPDGDVLSSDGSPRDRQPAGLTSGG